MTVTAPKSLGKTPAVAFRYFDFVSSPAMPKPIRGDLLDVFCLPVNGRGLHPKRKRGATRSAPR
jgi:hypothetical protein